MVNRLSQWGQFFGGFGELRSCEKCIINSKNPRGLNRLSPEPEAIGLS